MLRVLRRYKKKGFYAFASKIIDYKFLNNDQALHIEKSFNKKLSRIPFMIVNEHV